MSSVACLHLALLCVLHHVALAESEIAPHDSKSCKSDNCDVPGLESVETYQEYEANVLDVNLMQMKLTRTPKKMRKADGLPKEVPAGAVSESTSINNSLKAPNVSSVRSVEVDGLTTPSVWINAYARSGSSTLLALIAAAEGPTNGRILTLYEPSASVSDEDMPRFLLRMVHGNFVEGDLLQDAWSAELMSVETARLAAKRANLVAVKTITYGHDLRLEALPILEVEPQLRLVTIVRDPRAIYASQLSTTGEFVEADAGIDGLCSICDNFARNIGAEHERLHTVVFERMTTEPVTTAQALYSFLSLKFGSVQEKWINDNFDANCGLWSSLLNFACNLFGKSCQEYTTCSTNSEASNQKWRYSLTDHELQAFQAHQSCTRVAEFYGYPTGVIHQEVAPIDVSKAEFYISVFLILLIGYVWAGWHRSKRL